MGMKFKITTHQANIEGREGCKLLMLAVINNDHRMAETLIRAGADVNGYSYPFCYPGSYFNCMELTSLMVAERLADMRMANLLISNGADVNKRGEWLERDHPGHNAGIGYWAYFRSFELEDENEDEEDEELEDEDII